MEDTLNGTTPSETGSEEATVDETSSNELDERAQEDVGDQGINPVNNNPVKALVPDSPVETAKKGAVLTGAAHVGREVASEVAEEAAKEAVEEILGAVENSRAVQGLEAAHNFVSNIPVIGGTVNGAIDGAATTLMNGGNAFQAIGSAIKGGFHGAISDASSMVGSMAHGIQTAGHGFISGVQSLGASAVAGIKSAGSSIASWASSVWATATGSTAAVVATTASVVTVTAAVGIGGAALHNQTQLQRIGNIADTTCIESADTTFEIMDGNELFYASQIYSVMSVAGASRQETAGMLGNFSKESGIDPTSIETVYDEKYQIGSVKQSIIQADFSPNSNPSFPTYGNRFPLIKRLGIGLGQWTDTNNGTEGGRNTNLRSFADTIGKDWWTVDAQIAFVLNENRANIQTAYIGSGMSVDEATAWFMKQWEGIDNGTYEDRAAAGARLLTELEQMQVDRTYGESILTLANITMTEGATNAKQKSLVGCKEYRKLFVDNGDIAIAAATFAWPSHEQSLGNNGTDLFQRVATLVDISQPWMSCDRAVATAVRWAGADDHFPAGDTANQEAYMRANPDRWELVGTYPGLSEDQLQPGDILMNAPIHVMVYVGEEAVQKAHPDVDTNLVQVSASLGSRSAGLGLLAYGGDGNTYNVWRNIKQEDDSIYKSIPLNVNLE